MFDQRPRHARFLTSNKFLIVLFVMWALGLRLSAAGRISPFYYALFALIGFACLVLSGAVIAVGFWYGFTPRRSAGLCRECGYDLTGNTSGRCPECGTPMGPS